MIDSTGQIAYDYDMNSRLIEAGAANYSYDWVGNRLVPGSAQYNAADQLTSGFGHTYNYDGRGNLTSSVGANGKTFAYTPTNLLSSVAHAGVQDPSVMTWDGDSNRVSFSSSTGGTWQFVYDPTAGIPAVIEEVTPSGSVYYLREPSGSLIARVSGSDVRYYHFDALGSTRLLTDDSGDVTDTYTYDAWGNVISHDQYFGSIDQPYQFVGRLGYYTHWQDENLDLLQLGVRFYDSESGRFTQIDSEREGLSAYTYVQDLPTRAVDPTGRKLCFCPFRGNVARVKIDPSCDGMGIDFTIISEDGSQPIVTPRLGIWYRADGFVTNDTEWKVDGSTCTVISCKRKCGHVIVTFETCINLIALHIFRRRPLPYPFDWVTYPIRSASENGR